jgi:hypothetical protein
MKNQFVCLTTAAGERISISIPDSPYREQFDPPLTVVAIEISDQPGGIADRFMREANDPNRPNPLTGK